MMRSIAAIALAAGFCFTALAALAASGPENLFPPGTIFRDCDACPRMVVIPPGGFMMGSLAAEKARKSSESPRHRVNIGYKFAVGIYEVTQAEWGHVMQTNPSNFEGKHRPVDSVTWDDARAFVKKFSRMTGAPYRLLSEAEWEYAARAGTTTAFHTGNRISTAQANFNGIGTYNGSARGANRQTTVAVGSFAANHFGLHDIHGNVWEWVADCWQGEYLGAPSDGSRLPQDICSVRVLRGGAWVKFPKDLRSATREGGSITVRFRGIGFRIARTLPQ